MTALEEYGRHRDRLHPHPAGPSLLVSMQGTRMDIIPAERVFARLTRAAGIAPLSDRTRPTMKNLRHTFAVSTLIGFLSAVAVSTVSGVSYAQGCGRCRNVAPSAG